jgi:hypothetical protein
VLLGKRCCCLSSGHRWTRGVLNVQVHKIGQVEILGCQMAGEEVDRCNFFSHPRRASYGPRYPNRTSVPPKEKHDYCNVAKNSQEYPELGAFAAHQWIQYKKKSASFVGRPAISFDTSLLISRCVSSSAEE